MFFFSFYCLFGDGGFASKESPPSESSDSSDRLMASGSKGRGGGEAQSWGHGGGVWVIYLWEARGIGIYIAKQAIHSCGKSEWEGIMYLYKGLGYKSWPIPCP